MAFQMLNSILVRMNITFEVCGYVENNDPAAPGRILNSLADTVTRETQRKQTWRKRLFAGVHVPCNVQPCQGNIAYLFFPRIVSPS
jgi:hypothetical protein